MGGFSVVVITIATIYAVYNILKHFGVFETVVGVPQVVSDIKQEEKLNKKRKRERNKLEFYSQVTEYFRVLFFPEHLDASHRYFIDRLEIRSKPLDRSLTPEELRGKHIFILLVGVIISPLGVFSLAFLIITALCVLQFIVYPFRLRQKIHDEDSIIDIYFIDLYLLLYSKLRLGSKARLTVVVSSYIDTLNVSSNLEMKAVMKKFSQFLLNNLVMYEDHVAIPKLRERYKSATVINFCNVASQALQGVDNADILLTYKMELVRRKKDLMAKNAEVTRRKGERAIYLIYLVLFIFIVVGWYSKLPTGFF